MPLYSTRRQFIAATAGAGVLALTAKARARSIGANDRIRIGIIGCGGRGLGAHFPGVRRYAKEQNIEVVAVADPWRQHREEGAALVKEAYGIDAKQYATYQQLLAQDDIDAVMIATCDHQHPTHLEAAARAKKHVYCEKPLSNDLEKLKRACDAVRESGVVFQAGTQLRSMPSFTGCKAVFESGVLGKVGRVEQIRNGARPFWYSYIKDVNAADTNWKEFLGDTPDQPFDPVKYSAWMGYREFCGGPVPQLGAHFIDLVHYITGATFPISADCHGGTFTFNDEHKFTSPDSVQATWVYPDFLVTYSSNFGNDSGNAFRIYGTRAEMDMTDWDKPFIASKGALEPDTAKKAGVPVAHVEKADHMLDWLQCMRTKKKCNADIDAGYQHAVACIMAVRAYDTGKRQTYNKERREIVS